MRKFWNWYNELETTNPTKRFLIFLGLAIFCIQIIPVLLYFTIHLKLDFGVFVGLFVLAILAGLKVKYQ